MSTYVVCPDRDGKKVAVEVCVNGCKLREVCEEFLEVPVEVINSARTGLIPSSNIVSESQDEKAPVVPSGRAEEALKRALSIRTDIEAKFLEMGQVLNEIFENRYYLEYGPERNKYKDWKMFCFEVLGIKGRTATYLRDIYVKMTALEVPEQECAQIGWTKLAQILPIVNKKNVDHWIKEAKKPGATAQSLNAKVRVAQGKITEKEAEILPEKMIFSFFKEQREIVELALDIGLKLTGSKSRSSVLADSICPEFLSTYPSGWESLTKGEVIAAILRRYESGFNVRFLGSVVEVETGEVLLSWE